MLTKGEKRRDEIVQSVREKAERGEEIDMEAVDRDMHRAFQKFEREYKKRGAR